MKEIFISAVFLFIFVHYCLAGEFYTIGPADKKNISLTFDDGPGKSTLRILQILDDYNVKATFFVFGCAAVSNPDLLKEIYNRGHEVESHTYGHYNFYKYDKDDLEYRLEREIKKNEAVIEKYTGYKPFLVRYPNGYSSELARKIAYKNDYNVINWTYGCDWHLELSEEEMYKGYKNNIRSGAIFLMHDSWNNQKVINFLPKLIEDIKNEGYEIIPVGELLDLYEYE